MENYTEEEISEYLDYVAAHSIIISDYIKKNKVENKNIITQHLDEIGESFKSILEIINDEKVYEEFNEKVKYGVKPTKILRDFKIRQIMNGRDK